MRNPFARVGIILLIAFVGTVPAHSDPPTAPKRVGVLATISCPVPENPQSLILPNRLKELGWIEGRTLVIDCVSAVGRFDQLPTLAAELVARRPDVLVAAPSPAVRALKQATTTVPIVMLSTPDPVREGFVTNLARPEANITGVGEFGLDLVAKRIELLKDMLPRLARLAIVWSVVTRSGPDPAYADPLYKDVTTAAAALGFSWKAFKVLGPEDYDEIFAQIAAEEFDAAYMVPSPRALASQALIGEVALRHRMPTVGDYRTFAKNGFLLTYGVNIERNAVRGAEYVDKLLRGAKPADLPVEQPSKFELAINLRTAKAFGLTVPPSLLARADEVIE